MRRRRGADLFCGAGGTSTGIVRACVQRGERPDLIAVNHWPTAVKTHELNHPGVRHLCQEIDRINPNEAVPGGHLDILAASPECTFFSNAAADRPCCEQSRAQAWTVTHWATRLSIDNILIENVREFMGWCRLLKRGLRYGGKFHKKGRPDPRYKGEYFRAFLMSLDQIGYRLDWRLLVAADYGDPTERERFILLARKRKPVVWPSPTHAAVAGELPKWKSARSIIDWDLKGKSIFGRKKPLSPNTIKRIEKGLVKFGGVNAEPFLVMLYGTNTARSVERPSPAVTSGGNHIGLAEPFIFHLTHHGERKIHSVDDPVPTVTAAHRGELALVQPFTTMLSHNNVNARSIDEPVQTITTARCGEIALVEPFIVKYYGSGENVTSIDAPLATVTCKDRFMLVCPTTKRPVAELDILFRMLQPHELAAAQGFPTDYKFHGNRQDRVKQIGNAVPVNMATALCSALLS